MNDIFLSMALNKNNKKQTKFKACHKYYLIIYMYLPDNREVAFAQISQYL